MRCAALRLESLSFLLASSKGLSDLSVAFGTRTKNTRSSLLYQPTNLPIIHNSSFNLLRVVSSPSVCFDACGFTRRPSTLLGAVGLSGWVLKGFVRFIGFDMPMPVSGRWPIDLSHRKVKPESKHFLHVCRTGCHILPAYLTVWMST
ncbi:hypothetical protein BKA80DRAFT_285162 [Phyllosticta citrichinensis]